jgi:hypothetical protein
MEATRTVVFTSFSLMHSDCLRLQRLRKSWSSPSSALQQHRAGVANTVLECRTTHREQLKQKRAIYFSAATFRWGCCAVF